MIKVKRFGHGLLRPAAIIVMIAVLMAVCVTASKTMAAKAMDYDTTVAAMLSSEDFEYAYGTAEGATVTGTQYDRTYKGVVVSAKDGNDSVKKTLTFNHTFYVGDNTKDDILAEILIIPTEATKRDFDFLYVTLTDAHNDNNAVTFAVAIRPGDNAAHNQSVALAKANDGAWAGWHSGAFYQFIMGTALNQSFGGQVHTGTQYSSFKFFYDDAEKTVYAQPARGGTAKVKVRDLNKDINVPVNGANPATTDEAWQGFESGEVRLTISTEYTHPQTATATLNPFRNTAKDAVKFMVVNVDGQVMEKGGDNTITKTTTAHLFERDDVHLTGVIDRQIKLPMMFYSTDVLEGRRDTTLDYYVKVKDSSGTELNVTGLDGGKWTEGAYFVPSDFGNYIIEYYKDSSFDKVEGRAEVTVSDQESVRELFSFDSSLARITPDSSLPAYMEEVNRGGTVATGVKGVRIASTGKDDLWVKYNKTVDLSKFSPDDKLFEFIVTPEVKVPWSATEKNGEEFEKLYIRFSDKHNPNNYVETLYYRRGDNNHSMSGLAATANQDYAGWNNVANKLEKLHYGTPMNASFAGQAQSASSTRHNSVILKMDYANKQLMTFPSRQLGYTVIKDLDNNDHINPGEQRWEGFTTGEVEVSIRIEGLSKQASIVVLNMFGQDMDGEIVNDTTPPKLIWKEAFATDNTPFGEKGSFYPAYKVEAYDLFEGAISSSRISIRAYKDYGLENSKELAVLSRAGQMGFVPDGAGNYSLVYTVADSYYNPTTTVINLVVSEKLNPVTLSYDETLAANATVGQQVRLPLATAVGGSGQKAVTVTVIAPDGTSQELAAGSGFVTGLQGYYVVRYSAVDYLGYEAKQDFLIKNTYGTRPYMYIPSIAPAFVTGNKVLFPDFVAKDYHSYPGLVFDARKEIAVSENGGDYTVLGADNGYTPIATSGYVDIRVRAYSLLDSNYQEEIVRRAIINPTGKGELFFSEGSITREYSGHKVTYKATVDGTVMSFVNPLPEQNFSVEFRIPDTARFGRLELYLTDWADTAQSVRITVDSGTKNIISVGSRKVEVNNIFGSGAFHSLVMRNGELYLDRILVCAIEEYVSGEAYEGFASGQVYFSVGFDNIETGKAAEFYLQTLLNQASFSNDMEDRGQPGIIAAHKISKTAKIDTYIRVSSAKGFDVISGIKSLFVTVTAPDGTVKVDKAVPDNNIFIRTEMYGVYTITYVATDNKGNTATVKDEVTVKDAIAPTIEINGTVPDKALVGDKVVLPEAIATDNLSAEVSVRLYAIDPWGAINTITNRELEIKMAGNYTIIYYAQDEAGNFEMVKFGLLSRGVK